MGSAANASSRFGLLNVARVHGAGASFPGRGAEFVQCLPEHRVEVQSVMGQAEKWVALTELPFAALALSHNGYINRYQEAGADVWRIALTDSGRELAAQLAAK